MRFNLGFKKFNLNIILTCNVHFNSSSFNILVLPVVNQSTAISLYCSSLVNYKTSFLGLQSKLLKTEMEMVDFRQRYIKEKSRRMTLHNTLVVSFYYIVIGRGDRLIQ